MNVCEGLHVPVRDATGYDGTGVPVGPREKLCCIGKR